MAAQGLGLALSQRLAERMGGAMGVESRLGVGGSYLLVHGSSGPGRSAAGPSRGASPGSTTLAELRAHHAGARLLLADEDEPINRMITQELLEEAGLRVEIAAERRGGVGYVATPRGATT